jgi:hypothetical protein
MFSSKPKHHGEGRDISFLSPPPSSDDSITIKTLALFFAISIGTIVNLDIASGSPLGTVLFDISAFILIISAFIFWSW